MESFSVQKNQLPCESKAAEILPVFLSFQQFTVGGDLNLQSQLDVHQFLVLADLEGHFLLGFLQGLFQLAAQLALLIAESIQLLANVADQFPVGGDLNLQSQLDVHQVLVLADLAGHVLLGSLEGLFQVLDAGLGVLHGQLTTLLSLSNLGFQVAALQVLKVSRSFRNGSEEVDLILKGVHLGFQLNLVHVCTIDILQAEDKGRD
ncbi:hypothetical protein EYF80_043002 [Liparis tanakae]|uniref:Uncharacterized protein n=1 Tax=Liparis tanakae TaxID=230148 RepID=A0A4Z2G0K5_9TELE|nr:hypothetical protein EYF80_043002 [Liparis tanakae]